MRERDILIGLKALAKMIDKTDSYQFTQSDFSDLCIDAGIGIDPRTHLKWLRVAVRRGLIQKKKTPKMVFFEKGPNYQIFLGGDG